MEKVYILIGYDKAITSGEPSTFVIIQEKSEPFTEEEIENVFAEDAKYSFMHYTRYTHDYYETKAVYKPK